MKNISLFFFLLISQLGLSQNITGKIVDRETQEPLIGASILVKADLGIGTTTDIDGNFILEIEETESTLAISYIGYESQTITSNTGENLFIQLSSSAAQMEEVVVKAKKIIAQEFSVEKISKLGVYLNPVAKGDPLLAVQSLPASSNVDESANISLRGSPPSETGIFLNNVPIRNAVRLDQANGIGTFSIFNTSMIQSVNVFPSNPPIEFGGATSGAVALYTDDNLLPKKNSVILSLVGGGFYMSRKNQKKSSFVAYGNLSTFQGLKTLNPQAFQELQGFRSADGGLYFIHKFTPRSIFKIFNFTILEGYEFNSKEPGFDAVFTQNKNRNITVANYSYQWNNARLEVNQGLNLANAKYTIGNIDHDVDNIDYFLSLNYHYFKEKWSLKTGTSLTYYKIDAHGQVPQYAYAYDVHHPTFSYSQKDKVPVPEAYLYGKTNLSSQWVLGMGSRFFPGLQKNHKAYLSNQLNIAHKPDKAHTTTFSIGNYNKFQFPGVTIPEISISKSQQVAVDYRYEKEAWILSAAVYRKEVDQVFFINPIYGGELYAARRGRQISASIALAHIRSQIEEAEVSYPSRFDLNYFLKAVIKYNIPSLFEINAVYRHRQGSYFLPVISSSFDPITDTYIPTYASPTEGERLKDYRILDLSISKLLAVRNGTLILFANAGNLLNTKNIRAQSYTRDYSQPVNQLFNRRSFFVGGVFQW